MIRIVGAVLESMNEQFDSPEPRPGYVWVASGERLLHQWAEHLGEHTSDPGSEEDSA